MELHYFKKGLENNTVRRVEFTEETKAKTYEPEKATGGVN
jgi:hypothetical protein